MIELNLTSEAVARLLDEMQRKSIDLERPFKNLGDYLVKTTQERFDHEEAPDGTPWAPLSPVTVKRKGHARILKGEVLALSRQFNSYADANQLEWGSIMEYAAMQQFGGSKSEFPHLWGDIPARPFLGLSAEDEDEVLTTLREHLERE